MVSWTLENTPQPLLGAGGSKRIRHGTESVVRLILALCFQSLMFVLIVSYDEATMVVWKVLSLYSLVVSALSFVHSAGLSSSSITTQETFPLICSNQNCVFSHLWRHDNSQHHASLSTMEDQG